MKRIAAVVLIVILVFLLCSCARTGIVALPENITKISVSWNGGPNNAFSYTDPEKISYFVQYFTSLELSKAREDPMQYNGGGWVITVETESESFGMHHYGNLFFRTIDGKWWEIPYAQAVAFEPLLKDNIPDVLPQNEHANMWSE